MILMGGSFVAWAPRPNDMRDDESLVCLRHPTHWLSVEPNPCQPSNAAARPIHLAPSRLVGEFNGLDSLGNWRRQPCAAADLPPMDATGMELESPALGGIVRSDGTT